MTHISAPNYHYAVPSEQVTFLYKEEKTHFNKRRVITAISFLNKDDKAFKKAEDQFMRNNLTQLNAHQFPEFSFKGLIQNSHQLDKNGNLKIIPAIQQWVLGMEDAETDTWYESFRAYRHQGEKCAGPINSKTGLVEESAVKYYEPDSDSADWWVDALWIHPTQNSTLAIEHNFDAGCSCVVVSGKDNKLTYEGSQIAVKTKLLDLDTPQIKLAAWGASAFSTAMEKKALKQVKRIFEENVIPLTGIKNEEDINNFGAIPVSLGFGITYGELQRTDPQSAFRPL